MICSFYHLMSSRGLMGCFSWSFLSRALSSSSNPLGTMILMTQYWSPFSSPRWIPRSLMRSLAPLLVPGSAQNFKVTFPEDFALAEAVLKSRGKA